LASAAQAAASGATLPTKPRSTGADARTGPAGSPPLAQAAAAADAPLGAPRSGGAEADRGPASGAGAAPAAGAEASPSAQALDRRPGDALAALMAAERARAAAHNFFLELGPDSGWRWSWWPDTLRGSDVDQSRTPQAASAARPGAAPVKDSPSGAPAACGGPAGSRAPESAQEAAQHGSAACGKRRRGAGGSAGHGSALVDGRPAATWSGTMQVDAAVLGGLGQGPKGLREGEKAPGSRAAAPKLTLRLLTNTLPGAGGELGGGPGQFSGGAALLKSALQKNVRLGRVAQAHRCPPGVWSQSRVCDSPPRHALPLYKCM
jgi:hypothetical protein